MNGRRLRLLVRSLPTGKPALALNRGRSAWQSGHPAAAMRHLLQSLQAAVRFALPYEEAQAHTWLGCLLRNHSRSAGAVDDSELHFGVARRICERLSATWKVDEVRRLLR